MVRTIRVNISYLLIFTMDTDCVLCEEGTKALYVIHIDVCPLTGK
jgi:hypothetical protein